MRATGHGEADRLRDLPLLVCSYLGTPRAAALTFGVILALQGAWLFTGPSEALWVTRDEWRQISRPWSVAGLLADHNGHLSVLPVIMYKGLFDLMGFAPYWPYRLLGLGIAMLAVALARQFCVRVGVPPWIATLWACTLVMIQGGSIVVGQFQMTLALALALGCALLSMSGRVLLPALCAVGAVASSLVAVPVVAAGAFLAWRRQGLTRALILSGPAAVLFLAWWATHSPAVPSVLRQGAPGWMATALWQVPLAFSGARWTALILMGSVVVGAVWATARQPGPLPVECLALGGSAIGMLALTYLGRGLFPPQGDFFGRFVFLQCILFTPLLAWATMRLVTPHTALLALVGLPLLVGLIVNVRGWQEWTRIYSAAGAAAKASMAALLTSPAGQDSPDWLAPGALEAMGIGTGDARWAALRGISPARVGVDRVAPSPEQANRAVLQLRLGVTGRPLPSDLRCTITKRSARLRLSSGERLGFEGAPAIIGRYPIDAFLIVNGEPRPLARTMHSPPDGFEIEVVGDRAKPFEVAFRSAEPGRPFTVCR